MIDTEVLELLDPSIINEDELLLTAEKLLSDAGESIIQKADAMEQVCDLLLKLPDVRADFYMNDLSRRFKVRKQLFTDMLKNKRRNRDAESDTEEENKLSTPLITRVEGFITRRYIIRYNDISNQFQCRKKEEDAAYELMNENNIIRDLRKHHFSIPMANLIELLKSDYIVHYNPIREYFESLPKWDGHTDHIATLAKYIILEDETDRPRFLRMLRKMFIRSIACSFEESFNKHAFILVHEIQSSGKTTFLRWICPEALKDYYTEHLSLDKDGMIALTENFIINMDELSTLSKFEINALKSLLSKDKVKVRIPYERRPTILQRRCNFIGSTNRREFLTDETGNVRWICFMIKKINWAYMRDLKIDDVWAQAYYAKTMTQEDYQLTADEILENEEANRNFLLRTPEMELIQKYFTPATSTTPGAQFLTATDILRVISSKVTTIKVNTVNIGKALSILCFNRDQKFQDDTGYQIKGYWVYQKTDNEVVDDANAMSKIENQFSEKKDIPPF